MHNGRVPDQTGPVLMRPVGVLLGVVMAAGMSVDRDRAVRIFVFSGQVTPVDLEFIGRQFGNREHYRFTHREIVYFAPDVSLAQIETEDLGGLADCYFEALRTRDDVIPDESIWVMPDQVRSDARLWREFTRNPASPHAERLYVESLEAALAAYRIPAAWIDDIRQGQGFDDFGQVGALRATMPVS